MPAHILELQEPLRVRHADQFGELHDLIHDEYFDLETVSHDEEAGVVTIPYWRTGHDGPRKFVGFGLLSCKLEVDVIQSLLTIRRVASMEIEDHAQIQIYSFLEARHEQGVLTLATCVSCALRFTASELDVESRGLEIRGKARIGYGLFWEVGSSRVYGD